MPTIFFLRAIHFFFYLVRFGANLWKRDRRKPQVLAAQRSRIPAHLALLLVSDNVLERDLTEETFEESVIRVVGWCRDVGIGQLSVYDSEGVTSNNPNYNGMFTETISLLQVFLIVAPKPFERVSRVINHHTKTIPTLNSNIH